MQLILKTIFEAMIFRLVYQVVTVIGYPILRILGVFSKKLRLFVLGRDLVFDQLRAREVDRGKWVWFHVASLGEFEQARPIMKEYKKSFPNQKLLLTFFSPSGYEVQKDFDQADCVCYLPWDSPKNVNLFLDFCKIEKAFFVKYEFWPNYLEGLSKRGIAVFSVCSIFRTHQLFFKSYGKAYRNILFGIKHFFVQNEESKSLLQSIGINQVTVSGDSRVDRVFELTQNQKPEAVVATFVGAQNCFVAGSIWPSDQKLLNSFLLQSSSIKIILVPHEVSQKSIQKLEKIMTLPYCKWSNYDHKRDQNKKIMIVDTIGKLTKIYHNATFAYVGGGMKKNGLHNTLEPATYGIPVIIGKYYRRFQEAEFLVKSGGIRSVDHADGFLKVAQQLLSDPQLVKKMGRINTAYIKASIGASQKIIQTIKIDY